MPPVSVVTCRWKRRKPAYNGLIAHHHSGMAGSRLRSTATGGLALTLTARCDTSGDIAGDHTPHEAGKFPGNSSFCYIRLLVIFKDHAIVLSA